MAITIGEYIILTALLIFTISSAGLIVVALIDAPYQFWQHKKQLRMTFSSDDLKSSIITWDCQRLSDGSVNLILRNLLQDLASIEIEHKQKQSKN